MTEVAKTEMNVFAKNMLERVKLDELNANNQNRATQCAFRMNDAKIAAFFSKHKLDENVFTRKVSAKSYFCLYSIFFIEAVAQFLSKENASVAELQDNAEVALRNALAFADADKAFTQRDIELALNNSLKIEDAEKAKIIIRRKTAHSSEKRQATMCMNMLRELHIVTQINRDEFKTNDNAITKALRKKLYS